MANIDVEVDSQSLVQLVKSSQHSSWTLCYHLCRVRRLLVQLGATVSHVYRECNMVADALATSSLGRSVIFQDEASLPALKRGSLMSI